MSCLYAGRLLTAVVSLVSPTQAEHAGGTAGRERQEAVEAEQAAEELARTARTAHHRAMAEIIRVREVDLEALRKATMATRIQASYRGYLR